MTLIQQYKKAFSDYWQKGIPEAYGEYKKLQVKLNELEKKPSRKAQRRKAVKEAFQLVQNFGIDAFDKIVVMVYNDFEDLVEGMNEDDKFEYAKGIAHWAEHQYGGAFRA